MHGQLDITCPACGNKITWVKYTWTRADGHPDWELDVRCECGDVTDPLIIRRAFEAYHKKNGEKIQAGQNDLIDRHMGPGANDALEAACRERGLKI